MSKKIDYSFEQWCLDNNRQDLLDRWDYDLNKKYPSDASYKSNKKYYFKCPRGIHNSQLQNIQYFPAGKSIEMYCTKCRSFAQYIIDIHGEDYLQKIWNKDNSLDYWQITYKSNKKAKFNCLENSLHIYEQFIFHYSEGVRCPYCSNQKITKENSLGFNVPKMLPRWSCKNEKTPYEYALNSGQQVWWRCENNEHEDYLRKISDSNRYDFNCPKCALKNGSQKRIVNLTGQTFGELTVIEYDEKTSNIKRRSYWRCLCSCGNIKSMPYLSLKNGALTCGDKTKHYSGEKASNWKGGLCNDLQKERTSKAYILWRDAVYKKDWFTCQCCGISHGINKQVHHLYNFSDNEELRYSVNNGILLCDKCHYTTIQGSFHNLYGTTNNTPEQLEEYINNKRKELGINIPFTIESYLQGNILKPKIKIA